jgi:pimeloyl-ACP methyl ester carboxylesterase
VTYRHLIEALRPHYRCYVPDLPGAGDTAWSSQINDTIFDYATLMRGFVDQLKLERLALIGHDSGGGVARVLAADLGSRATCVILQNTELPDFVPIQVRALKLASRSESLSATLMRLLTSSSLRRSELGFGACFGDRSLIDGEFFEACIRPLAAGAGGHNAIMRRLDLRWVLRLPEIHARIKAPIHLFWGDQDRYFPLQHARRMAASFVQPGELRVIAGAKLYVHEEAADELSRFSLPLVAAGFASADPLPQTNRASLQS